MNEYALRFYALLEEAIKLDARDLSDNVFAILAGTANHETRKQILDEYSSISYDIIEDLKRTSNIKSKDSSERLRRELNG